MQLITLTNVEIKDGSIQIPKERLKEIKALQNPSIIFVGETQKSPAPKKKRKITSLNIDTRDISFDRDEVSD